MARHTCMDSKPSARQGETGCVLYRCEAAYVLGGITRGFHLEHRALILATDEASLRIVAPTVQYFCTRGTDGIPCAMINELKHLWLHRS